MCACLPGFRWFYQNLSCACVAPSVFDAQAKTCSINCSAINNTNNASSVNGSCVCVTPYKWNQSTFSCFPSCPRPSYFNSSLNNCSVNCSLLPLTNGTNPDGSCKCRTPYVWNWTTVRCEPPACPPSSYFDFSTNRCQINCSTVANARGTYFNGSCICKNGYFWNNTSQQCQDRCTVLPYSSGQPALANGSCTCVNSSYFYDTIFRVCRIQCWTISNINWFVYPQPVNYCICASGFIWNASTLTCEPNCSSIANTVRSYAQSTMCLPLALYLGPAIPYLCRKLLDSGEFT
jgi:hypothetical protein